MAVNEVSLLWDKIKIDIPNVQSLDFHPNLPILGTFQLNLTNIFTRGFGYLSIFSGLYMFGYYGIFRAYKWAKNYFKSLFNSKKYLNPESPIIH